MKVFLIAGARPNFMKIAPIYREALKRPGVECQIVHTGQHYDYEMSQAFFDDLELPQPDYFLEAGSGSHAVQTATIMTAFEEICLTNRPNLVIVVGDVNSTLACTIVAKKLWIQVAHVEAGLRSFDLQMPEEINRMVTDSISDFFFVTEKSGWDNLIREGKDQSRVHLVGHVMIDNLLHQVDKLEQCDPHNFNTFTAKEQARKYIFLTMHRPSNVDDPAILTSLISTINIIAQDQPIFFPVHPRTRKMIDQSKLQLSDNIIQLPPLGFKEALFLWKDASLVLTDSGGLQEETTALGIPCLTMRQNTERPITVELGSNTLVGNSSKNILSIYHQQKKTKKKGSLPPKWDGKSAKRIWNVLLATTELQKMTSVN